MNVLVDSCASRTHAYLDFRELELFLQQVSPCLELRVLRAMEIPVALPAFYARFFVVSLELPVVQIDEVNASQLSSIVELSVF